MNKKIFSMRWDIDHLFCLEKGVPNILSVCREHSVKCTFFINLGKSLNLSEWLLKSFKKSLSKLTDTTSINIIKKIGYFNLFKILLTNPDVGLSRVDILRRIIDEGHELGLHGGMNHMLWSRNIKNMPEARIDAILKEAKDIYSQKTGDHVFGFAAPGFVWNTATMRCLERQGFVYTGDIEGDEPFYPEVDNRKLNIMCIPVTVIGPDTVPLIEYHAANGKSDNEITDLTCKKISEKQFSVLYGHPCYEGLKTEILTNIFKFVKNNNYQVMTHKDIYDYYKNIKSIKIRKI
jgi:peptidoglycan/xylan/chitin deacetylase (PgdA/CDA1 family)